MANVIGQRVRRREDSRFLRGAGRYVDDMPLADDLVLTLVRSPHAHARIADIDVSEALELPGVQVFTAADVDLRPFGPPPFLGIDERMHRPILARDTVRFAGDIVAAVLAESQYASTDAADLVMIDYEELPVVTDAREAVKDGVLLYPDVGTNVCGARPAEEGTDVLAGCEVVVSGTLTSQRMAAVPLEPRSHRAAVGADGRLTAWLSTQTPHQDRDGLALVFGLDPADVRVVGPDVGGGFGAKGLAVEDLIVCWLAHRTGRAVRWTETRSENMVAMNHGRAQVLDFSIGGSRDGTIEAYRLSVTADAGAYPTLGAFLPNLTGLMASGVYAIPKIAFDYVTVATNTTPIGAFRGAGRPEAAQAIERAMDMFAGELGMDPAELRRRNFFAADAFPLITASGAPYDSGDYEGALDLVLEAAGYAELRDEQRRRREAGDPSQLGIGLATYVEITNGIDEAEFGAVTITPEGKAIARTGSFSHGQGHETTFAMIVAARLGLPVEDVTVEKGDTDNVPRGTGTYGSKSTQLGGSTVSMAAEGVVEQAKQLAADLLEAAPDDIELDLDEGAFRVAGAPQSALTWKELAVRADDAGRLGELAAEKDFASDSTFPFGAHIAVVEVDTETGSVELVRLVAVDDAGTLINPLIAEGQVHGGLAAGIGQALFEEMPYDEAGNPMNANFVSYLFPAATEFPTFETIEMQTPTPANPLGAKGIGESGTIGSTPAVHNAVIDALSPFGIRHLDMPVSGEVVWRAIQEAR